MSFIIILTTPHFGQQNHFWLLILPPINANIFRLQVWEDVLPRTQLENVSIIDHIQVSSRIECSQRCVIKGECKSINICYRRICQLNIEDRFSKGGKLEQNDTCLYVGMKQKYVPQCREKGTEKLITDDRYPGMRNILLFFVIVGIWNFYLRRVLSIVLLAFNATRRFQIKNCTIWYIFQAESKTLCFPYLDHYYFFFQK